MRVPGEGHEDVREHEQAGGLEQDGCVHGGPPWNRGLTDARVSCPRSSRRSRLRARPNGGRPSRRRPCRCRSCAASARTSGPPPRTRHPARGSGPAGRARGRSRSGRAETAIAFMPGVSRSPQAPMFGRRVRLRAQRVEGRGLHPQRALAARLGLRRGRLDRCSPGSRRGRGAAAREAHAVNASSDAIASPRNTAATPAVRNVPATPSIMGGAACRLPRARASVNEAKPPILTQIGVGGLRFGDGDHTFAGWDAAGSSTTTGMRRCVRVR